MTSRETSSSKIREGRFRDIASELARLESGRWCRSCSESIQRNDHFGMSEGVCGPCRKAA
jgi:hypothetical protein